MEIDIESGDRVRIPHGFTRRIDELEENGLPVFAGLQRRTFKFADVKTDLKVILVSIVKDSHPAIIRLGGDEAVLPAATPA